MLFSREELLSNSLAAGSKCFLKGVVCCGKRDKCLTLLHSERPKIVCNFGLSECNRAKVRFILHIQCTFKSHTLQSLMYYSGTSVARTPLGL